MSKDLNKFFTDLNLSLAGVREEDRGRLTGFFDDLNPKLKLAKEDDFKLDRRLARRFNIFDYVKTDEIGLSSIIADLLDPKANHGQGSLFLDILLRQVKQTSSWSNLSTLKAKVYKEKEIFPKGSSRKFRRIDIYVVIPGEEGNHCLAFENKPEASDQEDQVRDYFNYLKGKYKSRCVLLYLPSTGSLPAKNSISANELAEEKYRNHFAIMPYHHDQDSTVVDSKILYGEEKSLSDFNAIRYHVSGEGDRSFVTWRSFYSGYSVIEWLADCQKECKAERLRNFLIDAEKFCKLEFGDQTMTIGSKQLDALREFLLHSPENWDTAKAVRNSLPIIEEEVQKGFFYYMCGIIKNQLLDSLESSDDLLISYEFLGVNKGNFLRVYRKSWKEYASSEESDLCARHNRKTMIKNASLVASYSILAKL